MLLMYTWRRKATVAEKATEAKLDTVPVKTMERSRAMVMTRVTDKTLSMVKVQERMSTA